MDERSIYSSAGCRGFDDPLAMSLFKLALIEAYCFEEISPIEVENIFSEIEALRSA